MMNGDGDCSAAQPPASSCTPENKCGLLYHYLTMNSSSVKEEDDAMFFTQKIITSPATGELPSTEEFAGDYNFEMEIGNPGGENKRQGWQYSPLLGKVFITEGRTLPLQFKVSSNEAYLYVRAVAVYVDPDAATTPVLRCPNHKQSKSDPINKGYTHMDHVVSCNHQLAVYEVDPYTQRRSVSVILSGPQPGTEWEPVMYSMMCRSSCVNGINRRPLALIFTLEKHYQVLGRRVLPIRICASPFRDRNLEESKVSKFEIGAEPSPCKTPELGPLDNTFYVPVIHYEDFIALVKEARDLVDADYPAGPLRDRELEKYNNMLISFEDVPYSFPAIL